jgi:predicted nuclease of predicted toxin-antitoxin system
MKILLDECVSKRLKPFLPSYAVYTVTEMQWNGIKNGKLMPLCVDNDFDVLLTIDKSLMYQQNLNQYKITVAVLNSLTSKVEELATFIPSLSTR